MKIVRKAFGAELRALREAKGLGLRELAKKARISPAFLSKVERGEVTPPAEKKLKSLARALESEPDELMALAGRLPDDVLRIIQRHPLQCIALLRDLREHTAEEIDRVRRTVSVKAPLLRGPFPASRLAEMLEKSNDKVPLLPEGSPRREGKDTLLEALRQAHEKEGVK